MISAVTSRRPDDRDAARFVPRITVALFAGFVVFVVMATLYVLPVLLETAPPGAIPDYHRERVMAHLEGKVMWLLVAAYLLVTLVAVRGWLPGTGRRS